MGVLRRGRSAGLRRRTTHAETTRVSGVTNPAGRPGEGWRRRQAVRIRVAQQHMTAPYNIRFVDRVQKLLTGVPVPTSELKVDLRPAPLDEPL
jgi:hypothetical protein